MGRRAGKALLLHRRCAIRGIQTARKKLARGHAVSLCWNKRHSPDFLNPLISQDTWENGTSWDSTAPLKMCRNISRTWFSLSKKEHQPKVSLVSSSNLLWICPLCTLTCMTLPSDQQGLKSGLTWQNLFSNPTVNGPCCDNHCLQKTLEKGHTGPNNIHVGK